MNQAAARPVEVLPAEGGAGDAGPALRKGPPGTP